METDEERKARLEKMVATKWLWRWMKKEKQDWRMWYTQLILALETEEERRARLEHLSDNQHIRLSAEAQDKKCVLFCLLLLLFLLSIKPNMRIHTRNGLKMREQQDWNICHITSFSGCLLKQMIREQQDGHNCQITSISGCLLKQT